MKRPCKYTAKPQWCEYGERRFYARSKAEANHAAILEVMRTSGQIADWRHEPRRYVFPDRTRAPVAYLPDFEVTALDGSKFLTEVKGRWTSKDREKIRLMARHYPDVPIHIVGAQLLPSDRLRIEAARQRTYEERAKAASRSEKARKRRSDLGVRRGANGDG